MTNTKRLQKYNFENVSDTYEDTFIINQLIKFADLCVKSKMKNGLIIFENIGYEKTYLVACIANKMIEQNKIVLMEKSSSIIDRILKRFQLLGVTTKYGKEITHEDLRKAIEVMLKKHPTCRWRSEKVRSRKYFVLIKGYAWLNQVYFQKERSLIDADVDFFEDRVRQYEELLKIEPDRKWWNKDMNIKQLCEYFNRKDITVRKAIKKMCKSRFSEYKFLVNNKVVVSSRGVEWLCKNVFKQKYLELLEKYKMELTELYIEAGYPYDNFFGRN